MNIMVDLETLGTVGGSIILSIGAVAFNKTGIVDEFYSIPNIKSSKENGFVIDQNCLKWWEEQDESAKIILTLAETSNISINSSLEEFNSFLGKYNRVKLWGNGSDFDNAILSSAFQLCNIKPNWKFYNNRCYRTVKNMAIDVLIEVEGIKHNALDDAKSQAIHLLNIIEEKDWYNLIELD